MSLDEYVNPEALKRAKPLTYEELNSPDYAARRGRPTYATPALTQSARDAKAYQLFRNPLYRGAPFEPHYAPNPAGEHAYRIMQKAKGAYSH